MHYFFKFDVKEEECAGLPAQYLRDAGGTLLVIKREDLGNVVSWAESGSGFVIKDLETFSAQILPQYFKHKKYTSFVRQVRLVLCSSICMVSISNDTSLAITTTSHINTSAEGTTSPKLWIPSCC